MRTSHCRKSLWIGFAAALWTIAAAAQASSGEKTTGIFNIRDYGAVGDGKTLDTAAIGRAVQACTQAGGGTVLFPAGEYVSGTFELLNNVTLNLESGAVLTGSTNLNDYGLKTDYGIDEKQIGQSGEGLKVGIVVANKVENVGIVGHGVINGRGTYFVDVNTSQFSDQKDPKQLTKTDGPVKPWMAWTNRPGVLITFANCTNVLLQNVTIKDSHNWTINIGKCQNVNIRGIDVLNNPLIPNNDGLDISAKNARISDCNIWAGDDAIAANHCENLTVANCILSSRSSAIRFGDGRDCIFENLVIRQSNRGIGIYGSAHDVLFSDILIQTRLFNGNWWGRSEPIYISTRAHPGATGKPAINDIRFSNILADSEGGILIYGTEPGEIQNVSFDHVKLRIKGSVNSETFGGKFDLNGLGFRPDKTVFKHDIPALYCQYVDGLEIHGFDLEWGDNPPAYFSDGIHCEHVNNLTIDGFIGRQAQKSGSGAAIALRHVSKVSIKNCEAPDGTGTFLLLDDVKDQRLFINNDLRLAQRVSEPSQLDFITSLGNITPALAGDK